MIPRLAVLFAIVAPVLLPAPVKAAERRLEITFVADDGSLLVWIEASSSLEETGLARRARFAWFSGGRAASGNFDDFVTGAPLLGIYPTTPPRLPTEVTADGSLLFTLGDLGDWQAELPAPEAQRRRPRAEAPAVARPTSARLLVEAPSEIPPDGAIVPALVFGTERLVAGRAQLRTSAPDPGTVAFLRVGEEALQIPLEGAGARFPEAPFVADVRIACERPAPAVALVPTSSGPLRTQALGAPACLDEVVVLSASGMRLEARRDAPVYGLLISRPKQAPSPSG